MSAAIPAVPGAKVVKALERAGFAVTESAAAITSCAMLTAVR